MATKFRKRFDDLSVDPVAPIADTTNVRLQPTCETYPTGVITMTIPTGMTDTDTGWREASITNPGEYDIYLDTGGGYSKDTNSSPIHISSITSAPWELYYKEVTITGTYDSKETLTVGSGSLAATTWGGTPPTFSLATKANIILVSRTDRNFHWDNPVVAAGILSFDIWADAAGQDDTAKCDIIVRYLAT